MTYCQIFQVFTLLIGAVVYFGVWYIMDMKKLKRIREENILEKIAQMKRVDKEAGELADKKTASNKPFFVFEKKYSTSLN
jgi:hypothetical protein